MANYYADFDLGTGNDDGSTWANAFRTEGNWESFLEGTIAAGDIVYVMQSTCTADSAWDFSERDGTNVNPTLNPQYRKTAHVNDVPSSNRPIKK